MERKSGGEKALLAVVIGIAALAGGVLAWQSISPDTRLLIKGAVICFGGMFVGAMTALGIVGLFLLRNLKWSVDAARQPAMPPIILGGNGQPPALLPPGVQYSTPPSWGRQSRQWEMIGGDDAVVNGDTRLLPPGQG